MFLVLRHARNMTLEPFSVPEQRLLQSVANGEPCDFSGPERGLLNPNMDDWGDERRVRAGVLKALLTNEDDVPRSRPGPNGAVVLRGAVVTGELGGFRDRELPATMLEQCRFDDEVDFSGAAFTGNASFRGGSFAANMTFVSTSFGGEADFDSITVAGLAGFSTGIFHERARFVRARFMRDSAFVGAVFSGGADFGEVTFDQSGAFIGAMFDGGADFTGTTFTRDAWFDACTFKKEALFSGAAISGAARFPAANFEAEVRFESVLAGALSFQDCRFAVADPGPWTALAITFDHAEFAAHSRIPITAKTVSARGVVAREGAHLLLRCEQVNLSGSEFLRRSIISGPASQTDVLPGRSFAATIWLNSRRPSPALKDLMGIDQRGVDGVWVRTARG
jgi:hypothetical protein